jgi:hypothetical protein
MREQFSLDPCDASGQAPPFEWPELPALNPPPETVVALQPDTDAYINTTRGERQFLRPAPGTNNTEIDRLEDGTRVAILDGPEAATGYWWWQVEVEDGTVGWVADYYPPENLQTLVPAAALE